ncbi:Dps family protein [Pseudactinotalea suaedae]|uniref:Dps family protein n=1 Tax=Pseudactinotalea suaedae TaxID=1524924 RepID=UPI0012E116C1|nr:DNA starvation/stationary phase protection protein [Pseudactinotalea suaedae]
MTRTTASEKLRGYLQRVLVDLIDLQLQGKQAHWNVTGRGFRSLHLQLDELVAIAREESDVIAERMRALQVVPDGRTETVSATTDLTAYAGDLVSVTDTVDAIVDRISQTVTVLREVHSDIEAEDPPTADLINNIVNQLEQQSWMIASQNLEA